MASDRHPENASERLARFRIEVIDNGDFTEDWFTRRIDELEPFVEKVEASPARILEIGSFEGLSTCWFLWRLPRADVTCIDTFMGTPGTPSAGRERLEEAFDRNVALVGRERVRKLVGESSRWLVELCDEGARFDLVYVDGSHSGLDVLVDAALSWPLVVIGGLIVFDDYRWEMLGDDPLLRPGPAIDAFLGIVAGSSEVESHDGQVIARRLR